MPPEHRRQTYLVVGLDVRAHFDPMSSTGSGRATSSLLLVLGRAARAADDRCYRSRHGGPGAVSSDPEMVDSHIRDGEERLDV